MVVCAGIRLSARVELGSGCRSPEPPSCALLPRKAGASCGAWRQRNLDPEVGKLEESSRAARSKKQIIPQVLSPSTAIRCAPQAPRRQRTTVPVATSPPLPRPRPRRHRLRHSTSTHRNVHQRQRISLEHLPASLHPAVLLNSMHTRSACQTHCQSTWLLIQSNWPDGPDIEQREPST